MKIVSVHVVCVERLNETVNGINVGPYLWVTYQKRYQ